MLHRILTFFCLTLVILGSSWSLFNQDFFKLHDFTHAARIIEMVRAVEDGHIVPRWSQNFGFGYGMPLFEFYAPLPYYVGALLFLIGIPMILVLKLLFIIANVMTALGSYKIGKVLFGSTGGWVTAALITLAPYRAVNLYIRGAVSEIWGIMALPWILYGIYLIFNKSRYGFLILTLSFVALFLSHNLMTMIAVPSVILFFLIIALQKYSNIRLQHSTKKDDLKEKILLPTGTLITSGLLSIALSSFYIIPALLENDYTKVKSSVINAYFDYHLHFLYIRQFITNRWGYGGSEWGPNDGISFFLGVPQLLLLGMLLLILILVVFKSFRNRSYFLNHRMRVMIGIGALIGLAINIFMTTEKTLFIWDAIEALHFVQFPWRWLGPGIIWLGLLGGLTITFIKTKVARVFFSITFVLLTTIFNASYFMPEEYLSDFNGLYYIEAPRISEHMSIILNDYMPKNVPLSIMPAKTLVSCYGDAINFNEACPAVKILTERAHEKLLAVTSENELLLTLAIADFPGWIVELDGQQQAHNRTGDGLIQIAVPPGEHTIGARFSGSSIRNIADSISLLSLIFFGYYLYVTFIYNQTKKKNEN